MPQNNKQKNSKKHTKFSKLFFLKYFVLSKQYSTISFLKSFNLVVKISLIIFL